MALDANSEERGITSCVQEAAATRDLNPYAVKKYIEGQLKGRQPKSAS
jgi:hypothetical protein